MISQDERIRRDVLRVAAALGENGVSCSVEDGDVVLEGSISSDEQAYQLEAAVKALPAVRFVTNDMSVEGFAADVDNTAEGVDLTPDFTSEVGTGDAITAASEGEPYFPPTDPVVKPDRSWDGIEMLGGFAESADEKPTEVPRAPTPPQVPPGDEELRERVVEALHLDAATTDLPIEVEVQGGVVFLRGSVPSLDDADSAETVASRVQGVEEVEEELEIRGL